MSRAGYSLITSVVLLIATAGNSRAEDINNVEPEQSRSIFSFSLEELPQIKVRIATGTEQPLLRAPSVAYVISASDIAKLGARTLDEILETVPGLHVSASGVNRLDTIYSLRGIHTGFNPHILMHIDGNPVQWPVNGGRPFMLRIPASAVERVEIIRGPGSAVYGSDAFAGVINVITKSYNKGDPIELGARLGSFESRDFWLNWGRSYKDWLFTASLNYLASEGDPNRVITRDLQTALDENFGTRASLAPGALATDYEVLDLRLKAHSREWQISLWNWSSYNTGNGAGGAQALDPYTKENYQSSFADIQYTPDRIIAGWQNSLDITYLRHKTDGNLTLLPAGSLAPIGADGNIDFANPAGLTLFSEGAIGQPIAVAEDTVFEWAAIMRNLPAHQIRISAGYRKQALDSSEKKNFGPGILDGSQPAVDGTLTDVSNSEFVYIPDTSREIYHLSIQDEWALAKNWMLTGGVRIDDYSDFGNTTNPRLALVWDMRENLTGKLLYGSAFRAPSFGDLHFQNNPATIGNPDLEPETIDTLEASFSYQPLTNLHLDINIYAYQAEKLIEFTPGPRGLEAQNARDQNGEGLEFEVKWAALERLSVLLNGAWQKAYDANTQIPIADAPRRQAKAQVNWEFAPEWLLNIDSNWIADRQRAPSDARAAIDDYSYMDLHLIRQNLIPGFDISLKIRNIFQENMKEPSGDLVPDDYPMEGRGLWLQLQYRVSSANKP